MIKPKKTERDNLIIDLISNNKSLAEIGRQFNISRQRVGQIMRKRGLKKVFIPTEEWKELMSARIKKSKKSKVVDKIKKEKQNEN